MKRFIVCLLSFALGMGLGSGIRYTGTAQAAYRRGFGDGVDACHVEAVREGHAEWHFSRPGDASEVPAFRWRNNRPNWRPNMGDRFIEP